MLDLQPAPETTRPSNSETTHWWCCNPAIGICGTDITDAPEADDDTDVNCHVCIDLVNEPCPLCGSSD